MSSDPLVLALVALAVVFLCYVLFRPKARLKGQAHRPDKADASSSADDADRAYLEDMSKATAEESYLLSPDKPAVLGRSKARGGGRQCITILSPTVGRRHAMVYYHAGKYWLVDKGSRNGSFINGERVSGKKQLEHDDIIKIYKYPFRFVLSQQEDEEDLAPTEIAGEAAQAASPEVPQADGVPAAMQQDVPQAFSGEVDFLLDDVGAASADEDITLENFISDETLAPRPGGDADKA